MELSRIGVAKTVLLLNRAFVSCQKKTGGLDENGE